MTEQELQAIKRRAYYGSNALLDFDLIQSSQADVLPLIAEVERLQEDVKSARKSRERKRKEAKVLANACRKHKLEKAELQEHLDRTELAEAQARMEIERLRKELIHLRELWRYGTPEQVYGHLPRIAQMILDNEEGEWIG